MTIELGGVLVGLAALIGVIVTAIDARRKAKNAEATADAALKASPTAILAGLRREVQGVVDSYHESADRWREDRESLEDDRDRERDRADASEAIVLMLRGELASLRIDLASAQAELTELRTRFETAIANNGR